SCTIEDENDYIKMMEVHRRKTVGEGTLLIFRQESEDMMEEDVPQSCSSPVYKNMIREVVDNDYAKSSQLHVTKKVDVSIVGGETFGTQFLEASHVPNTYGGKMLQNQFVKASLVPGTCGARVDVVSSQHVRDRQKSCLPRPNQV
ncbi:hypothetical protein IFM89_011526, partial [Coptis chinensis]